MLILVTGSRTWTDRDLLGETLADLARTTPDTPGKRTALMHGACPQGADALAAELAHEWGWVVLPRPAEWHIHGRLAGPVRNGEMVAETKAFAERGTAVRVAAFTMPCKPGCRLRICRGWTHGTDHCGQLAAEEGLTGWWVRPDGTRDPLGRTP